MSERGTWKAGVAYSWRVVIEDAAGARVTGLANGAFTKRLTKNDANDATAVTVTEVDAVNQPGHYKVVYTPGTAGYWVCDVAHATYGTWVDEIQAYASDPLDVNAIADAILDRAAAVDGYSPRQALALIAAAVVAKCSGEPSNPVTFRSLNDAADRIAASYDTSGNRTAVTLTPP